MSVLQTEIAVYENLRVDLEQESFGKWILIHGKENIGIFDTFEDAAVEAGRRFGRGPYLIRQVGAVHEQTSAAARFGSSYAYG